MSIFLLDSIKMGITTITSPSLFGSNCVPNRCPANPLNLPLHCLPDSTALLSSGLMIWCYKPYYSLSKLVLSLLPAHTGTVICKLSHFNSGFCWGCTRHITPLFSHEHFSYFCLCHLVISLCLSPSCATIYWKLFDCNEDGMAGTISWLHLISHSTFSLHCPFH